MKNKILYIVTSAVFLLAFNLIFFLFKEGSLPGSVRCSYAFIHVAYAGFLLTRFLEEDHQEASLKLSTRAIGLGYFIIAFLVGLVVIFIAPESAKVPLTIQIILLAIFIVLLVVNIVNNNKIQQNIAEREDEAHVFFRVGDKLHGELGDNAKRALRANHQVQQAIARACFRDLAAQAQHLAARQNHRHGKHIVARGAVLHGSHAASIR